MLGICANTMHRNYGDVQRALSIPVADVRDAVAARVRAIGHESMSLLGTKYILDSDFYSSAIEAKEFESSGPLTSRQKNFRESFMRSSPKVL